jgi:predicted nucleotidyltransferase
MLKGLISSKTRRLLLNTFFSDPEAEYYTRQLAAMHKISVGTVHRELRALLSFGVLNVRGVGNIKLFSLNRRNPIYEEMKNMILKTEGAVKFVKEAVADIAGVKVAFIYGSFAKGDQRPDSDIDIFVIGDGIDENRLVVNISALEKKLFKEINYTWYTEAEYKKEKKKNSFISEIMKGKKIFIKGDEDGL